MPQRITGHTQLIGLIATPIRHSKSPMLHNTAFERLGLDYVYTVFDVPPEGLADAVKGLKALGVKGWNVSMPHKSAIIPLLDEISPVSRLCNSVNTVINDNGRLYGTVTDGVGYMRSLAEAGFHAQGKKLTLLGCGGAANAVAFQAALDGVGEITIFNRSPERARALAARLREHTPCAAAGYSLADTGALARALGESQLLCNATGVGMGALEGRSPIPNPGLFHPGLFCTDLIYAPEKTALLAMAEASGCPTMNGLGMLLYQAAESFRLWTGHEMPVDAVKAVL